MKGLGGNGTQFNIPSYVVNPQNGFDPLVSGYNANDNTLRNIRAALAKAQAGLGFADIAVIGDSLQLRVGSGGLPYAQVWPAMMRARLAQLYGNLVERPGYVCGLGMQDLQTYQFGMATAGATYPFSGGINATWTCALPLASTDINMIGPKTNPSAGATTVDAVAANPFPIPGGAGYQSVSLGGPFADALHTVAVTNGAGGGAYHGLFATGGAAGIRVSNLAVNGTCASFGSSIVSWSDMTATSLLTLRLAALAAAGVVPQLWVYVLGGNDLINDPVASRIPLITAGALATINALPGVAARTADVIIVPEWSAFTVATALQTQLAGAYYALADSLNCALLDWYLRVGGQATGFANGLIGTDGLHPALAGHRNIALAMANMIGS